VFILILLGFIIHWLSDGFKEKYRTWFVDTPLAVKAIIVILAVLLIYQGRSAELQPFIYFQF